jgi:hypothetical protein
MKKQTIVLPVVVFYLLALPLILMGYSQGRAFFDQSHFHLPVIEAFVKQFDFSDYHAATTPGYHAVLAGVAKVFGSNESLLKLVSSLFSAGLIALLASYLCQSFDRLKTLVLLLPLIFSIYFLPAGVWLLPDNLAWLSVAVILLRASQLPLTKQHYILMGLVLFGAVLVRQSNLWLAAIIWASALSAAFFEKRNVIVIAVIATLPAFCLLFAISQYWGGLVPPSFQNIHQHFSFSVPAFFFAAFAFYSLFYLPIIFFSLKQRIDWRWIAIGALIGFSVALGVDTDYNRAAGRFSGLWNFVKLAPVIGHKSVLLIILSTIGGGLYCAMLLLLTKPVRLVIGLSTLAFIVALIPNQFVYERYFSGFIFILLVVFVSHSTRVGHDEKAIIKPPRWVWVAPLIFALFNGLILFRGLQ